MFFSWYFQVYLKFVSDPNIGITFRNVPATHCADSPGITNRDADLETAMQHKFPEVEDAVMVNVRSIAEMSAYVSLLEYNIEGMILLSELSRSVSVL